MVSKSDAKRFYVYLHVHPKTHEIVYVGNGTAGRAWACGFSPLKAPNGMRGNRTEDHQRWIQELLEQGYTPGDYVQIVAKGLDKKTASQFESKLIEKHKGAALFNRMCYGLPALIVTTSNQIEKANKLRTEGFSYARIGKQLKLSTMTVWRALNGRTKGLITKGATNGR